MLKKITHRQLTLNLIQRDIANGSKLICAIFFSFFGITNTCLEWSKPYFKDDVSIKLTINLP